MGGKAVKPTAALLLTEENGTSLAEAFEEVGLDLDGPHGFLPVENASTEWSWADILVRAVEHCKAVGFGLLIVDPVGVWATVGNANDYGEAGQLMKIARVAAHESGIPILLIHHARERSGDTVDAALGSTAWTGGVDHIIALKGMEGGGNGRVLNFATRYRSSEKTYTVVLGDDGEYHATQGQGDVAQMSVINAAYDGDFDLELTFKDIAERAEVSESQAGRARTFGTKNGFLEKVGKGKYRLKRDADGN